jgi:hypothetical protein
VTGCKVGDETIHTALLDIVWTGDEGPLNVTSSFSPPLTDAPERLPFEPAPHVISPAQG